jgi:hypothetical protein
MFCRQAGISAGSLARKMRSAIVAVEFQALRRGFWAVQGVEIQSWVSLAFPETSLLNRETSVMILIQ